MPDDAAFPILSTSEVSATRAFYARLGFIEVYRFPQEGEPAFVALERTGATIGIAAATGSDVGQISYWLYVDDVDATYAEVIAAGAPGLRPPTDEPWGERVATVGDPAGFEVHLGQRAPDDMPEG
jgi:uncharacterized glyoxalase superfamily protein PhnB